MWYDLCMRNENKIRHAQAIKLRNQGLSYGEIRTRLNIPKSTLSLWLKTVPLKQEHRARLYTKQIEILSRGPQSQKERRARAIEEIIRNAKSEIGMPLSQETMRLVGAALYWAEGSKNNILQITNSDPSLILFFVEWLNVIFNIPPHTLKARLNIYAQQHELNIKKFWSELTRIPLKNFGKTYVKPLSSGYKKNNLYYGTMRIEVPKSVDMKHRIFGWIQATLQLFDKKIVATQKRWRSLEKTPRPVNL